MSTKPRAIVIGAGPMGLATAHRLAAQGWAPLVLEADDRIGGMSAHFDFDGLSVERYYHFLCKMDDPLLELLEELGLSDLLRWETTRMGLFYDGVMYEWGRPDALLTFPHLSMVEKFRYGLHVLRSRFMPDWRALDDVEATAWIRSWLGERAYEMLWKKTFEYKFYELHENISAAWIATRIRRVALSRRDAMHEEMGYIEGGSHKLLDALAQRIEAAGGEIRLDTPVQQVLTRDGRVTGVRSGDATFDADLVVSTIPAPLVPDMVPDLPADERARIEAIDNIGVVCVQFKLSEQFTPYFWTNVNDAQIEVPGVIEFTNLNPLPAHIVYVPYYMPPTHPKWSWAHDRFAEEALEVLQRIRPDFDPATVLATNVSRYRYSQPICTPGFGSRMPPMATRLDGFFMADTSYCYPEDRSISESVRIATRLAELCGPARTPAA